jgi:hypothetical protein
LPFRTGIPNKIQVSSKTAALLEQAGKGHWLQQCNEQRESKGTGNLHLKTYWIIYQPPKACSVASEQSVASRHSNPQMSWSSLQVSTTGYNKIDQEKHNRLVNLIADLLLDHLKEVKARLESTGFKPDSTSDLIYHKLEGKTCMDEVVEIINLPEFDAVAAARAKHQDQIKIDPAVVERVKSVVSEIAQGYHDNSQL